MVDVEKALMAIEEKEKWEEREEKILDELREVRKKKKELKKEMKKIKRRISDCESTLRSIGGSDKKTSEVYLNITEEMKRI
ncbi:MAG: hypothetical protein KGY66_00325 [Candidatus Thermoplasmatota archaeon]|nr:hypothetical protein [Candidatus Thermoplasmatota archaeon]MBS3789349.1 hypothetical protein [Candidatus Thermoplasmatota archaeon]